MKFTCPHCKNHRLEEIMVNVAVASEIVNINEEGDHEYGEQTNEGGEVSKYQCISCGYIIGEQQNSPVVDCVEMAKWVKENCLQED